MSGLSSTVKMEVSWSGLSLVWESWTQSSLVAAEERLSAGTEERFSQLMFSFLNREQCQSLECQSLLLRVLRSLS